MFATQVSRMSDKLTYSEKKIAKLILENSDSIDSMTSEQIAQQAGCAQATVSRFSQKLGYPNFKSMLLDVATTSLLHKKAEVGRAESLRDTMFKVKNLYTASLEDAIASNSDDMIDQAVTLLENARMTLFFGVRGSQAVVSLLYYRMLEIGLPVLNVYTVLEGVNAARNFSDRDVVFLMSVSGETAETVSVAKAAAAAGAKIVSITGSSGNTISSLSDVALKSAEYNVHTNRVNLVNRVPALFLIDAIFMRLWQKNEPEYLKKTEDSLHSLYRQALNAAGEPDAYRF